MIATVRRLALAALVVALPTIAAAQTYTISPPPFLLAQNNSGAIINNACIWTYAAGTTTPATTYTTSTGVANLNPIRSDSAGRFTAFLSPGTSYKFVYESACTPPAHGTVLRTADNIPAMPASAASVDVTGTAGESLTLGQCVYLSDGSGSKMQGQWYKCDAANAYSSTSNDVGIATVNIASAGTGTIRRGGVVSGLSSLTIGAVYYAGTAGALTATAPAANARKLGQADSATTFIVGDPPPPTPTAPFVNDFRLSLTTATCETTTDVTAATTLFLTPCTGNRITLFDTSGNVETCSPAEISLAVPATTSQLYDVWAYDSTFGTCTVTLEVLAWTSDTARATAIARSNGRWAKSGNTSRLYVGSFRTTTVSGQTEDSDAKRYLWNMYNRRLRRLQRFEATTQWNYTTATIRQANGAVANQVDTVVGLQESALHLTLQVSVANATAGGVNVQAGIGEGSTTTFSTHTTGGAWNLRTANDTEALVVTLDLKPAIGRQFWTWLEYSAASGTTTWTAAGGFGAGSGLNGGLTGWIEN